MQFVLGYQEISIQNLSAFLLFFGNKKKNSGKSKKLKLDGLLLSKKYIPSAKILYTKDLSNITFNYLCENSQNLLCHFRNHQSFFTTQIPCIFLAQTLHTFEKPSRVQIFRLSTALVKINQNPHISTSQFLFKFCVILQCYST